MLKGRELAVQGGVMLARLLQFGVIAFTVTMGVSAVAQPISQADAAKVIQGAYVFSSQVRGYHRGPAAWIGHTPLPPSYCRTMSAGEFALKDLARLASKAIQAGQLGLALRLEKAGDGLSDELDQEEEINDAARMTYDVYPCPRATSAYTARADMLRLVERAAPICRRKAHALRVSFAARRTFMQQCLRPY
jgi:hypothetical protein